MTPILLDLLPTGRVPYGDIRLARWRVRWWLALERHAERRLVRAYDRLAAIEARTK